MRPAAEAVWSFAQTRRLMRPGLKRAAFEAWQGRALAHWLAHDLPHAPAYGKAARTLAQLPVTDKAALMADFAAFNIAGVTTEEAWAAIPQGGLVRGLTGGQARRRRSSCRGRQAGRGDRSPCPSPPGSG